MLAGLGQAKIQSQIQLYETSPRQKVGDFELNKTFAWGASTEGSPAWNKSKTALPVESPRR